MERFEVVDRCGVGDRKDENRWKESPKFCHKTGVNPFELLFGFVLQDSRLLADTGSNWRGGIRWEGSLRFDTKDGVVPSEWLL